MTSKITAAMSTFALFGALAALGPTLDGQDPYISQTPAAIRQAADTTELMLHWQAAADAQAEAIGRQYDSMTDAERMAGVVLEPVQ